jgi:hypothetical protein
LLAERVHYDLVIFWLGRAPSASDAAALIKDPNVRVQSGKPPAPDAEIVKLAARGLTPDQLDAVQHNTGGTVFTVDAPVARRFEVLDRVIHAVDAGARKWRGLIYDPGTGELHSPDGWKERRIDKWEGGLPDPFGHTVSHLYPNGSGTYRLVTLGMVKFGLPDLAVDSLPMALNDEMQGLTDWTAFELIRHPALPADGVVTVDVEGKKARVKLAPGKPAENEQRVLAFVFEGKGSLSERQSALLAGVYGTEAPKEQLASKDDAELLAARDRARARLPDVRRRFKQLNHDAAAVVVKAPFVVDGHTKYRWVEVSAWDGETISGTLAVPSRDESEAPRGTQVTVAQKDVFDYFIQFADGTTEGGETNALLERRAH